MTRPLTEAEVRAIQGHLRLPVGLLDLTIDMRVEGERLCRDLLEAKERLSRATALLRAQYVNAPGRRYCTLWDAIESEVRAFLDGEDEKEGT